MKFTANNTKNVDYNEQHVLYVGATTGGLKSRKFLNSHIVLFIFNYPHFRN